MIKKVFVYVILYCSINVLYSSQHTGDTLLKTSIKKAMENVHGAIITEKLENVSLAHQPLTDLCAYLTEIPSTSNFKIIHTVFEHLKTQVNSLNQSKPLNQQSAIQIQADYCKLLYACFELHNEDIKKRFFPVQNSIGAIMVDLQTYINLYHTSFHQAFPGLIDYTVLHDSIKHFLKKITDPEIHVYIPLKIKNVTDSLQKLQQAIDTVSSDNQEEQIDTDLAINEIYNAYNQLKEMQCYFNSKEFFVTLPLIHHSFSNSLNHALALMVAENDQFKSLMQYTKKCSNTFVADYVVKPCSIIKNMLVNRQGFYEIVKKEAILNYIMKPLHGCTLSIVLMPKDKPWYDIKGTIEEGIKKIVLIKPIQIGKESLEKAMHTMENNKNSLQIDLDKKFFDPDNLEKVIGNFFLKLPIHGQTDTKFSFINTIFLPNIVIKKQYAIMSSLSIEKALLTIIDQLDNKKELSEFIQQFKTDHYNDFCKRLVLFTQILPISVASDFHEYVLRKEYIFIYNKKFYRALDKKISAIKINRQKLIDDITTKKDKILKKIKILEIKSKNIINKQGSSTIFEKIVETVDGLLYKRESYTQKQVDSLILRLKKAIKKLKEEEVVHSSFMNDCLCIQDTIMQECQVLSF